MSSALFYACWYNRVDEALRLLATANSADVNYCHKVMRTIVLREVERT